MDQSPKKEEHVQLNPDKQKSEPILVESENLATQAEPKDSDSSFELEKQDWS